MTEQRCGLVAVVGAPNAGKSTLVNALVGQKVAIVSPKAQTTRAKLLGVACGIELTPQCKPLAFELHERKTYRRNRNRRSSSKRFRGNRTRHIEMTTNHFTNRRLRIRQGLTGQGLR